MALQLDHVFVCVAPGGSEAASALSGAGLVEGAPNTHRGQGTSCRRFFVGDRYIELLWVHDEAEARGPLARPTRLWERWRQRSAGACPVGLMLRPADPSTVEPPFAAFAYRPSYLPAGVTLFVGDNAADIHEPAVVFLPVCGRPGRSGQDPKSAGPRELTAVRVIGP